MLSAQVLVQLLPETFDVTDGVQFLHSQNNVNDSPRRDVPSSKEFWVVRNLGAYELSDATDNDIDGELDAEFKPAATLGSSASNDNPTNFVFCETTRDYRTDLARTTQNVVNLLDALDRISAHEALHQFFGWHGVTAASNQGIMQYANFILLSTTNIALTPDQIKIIQRTRNPK